MKMAHVVDELTIADTRQAERAERQLEQIRTRRAQIVEERAATQDGLGRALALIGLGHKGVKPRAGELSLRRSGLESEDRDLAATEHALEAALRSWEQVELERARTALVARFDQHTAQRKDAEQRYAAVIAEAIAAAKALRENQQAYQALIEEAARLRAPIPKDARPARQPAVVVVRDIYTTQWYDPVGTADRWLRDGCR